VKKKELLVRKRSDREIVKRVDVSGKSEQMIEKVMSGMLRNMDTDNYFIDET
jgi:hypothetical protein